MPNGNNTRRSRNKNRTASLGNDRPVDRERRALKAHREKRKPQTIGKKKNLARSHITTGKILSGIIFVLAVLYLCGYTISFFNREKVPFEVISIGHIDSINTIDGVIIRDETIYSALSDGAVYINVSDNERVKKGTVICNIRDEDVVSDIELSLDAKNKEIFDKQKSREDLSIFSDDVKRVNTEIKQLVNTNIGKLSSLDLSSMYDFKLQVQKKIDARNQMLLSEDRGTISDLVNEQQQIRQELSKNTETIVAEKTGIVSFHIDGYESVFAVSALDSLTAKDVKLPLKETETPTGLFKIIASNDWYIAAETPARHIESVSEGDALKIYIKTGAEDKELDVSVEKIVTDDKTALLILKSKRSMLDFVGKRDIRFELNKPLEGYKIPNSAILEQTLIKIPAVCVSSEGSVNKFSENGVQQIQINAAEKDADGDVYVSLERSGIKLGDTLQSMVDTSDMHVLENVKSTVGVFIVNSGVAEFKSINTENMAQNSTHTVLKIDQNPNLLVYDRIVTDAKKVEKGQIVVY